ncbi:TetR/AcrR family transcriptional regulator [Rhodococcus olei]|uniref:TetR/AcrR family transcriptional regulator n=1 Tax=Rhodococcus olei TaxID=2161675 RepID=A0ABP8PIW7_9NOCA
MPHHPSRRESICDAALDLAAAGGNHAITHQAIDRQLGLAKGSTSYYFRTRHALVTAAVTHLTERSRDAFGRLRPAGGGQPTPDKAADLIADYVETLLTTRRRDVLARYALSVDGGTDPDMRAALAASVFSVAAATELMRTLGAGDASGAARDLISLLEGLLFDMTCGSRAYESSGDPDARALELRAAVALWLEALRAR